MVTVRTELSWVSNSALNQNVEPSPNMLRAPISPSIMLTRAFEKSKSGAPVFASHGTVGDNSLSRAAAGFRSLPPPPQSESAPADHLSILLRHVPLHRLCERTSPLLCAAGQRFRGLFDNMIQPEIQTLQIECAGFEIREIENIVDDAHQPVGAVPDNFHEIPLFRVSSPSSNRSVIPITRFMGVRISLLMLARNSDLTREAPKLLREL
jgi:hypothetical protein